MIVNSANSNERNGECITKIPREFQTVHRSIFLESDSLSRKKN